MEKCTDQPDLNVKKQQFGSKVKLPKNVDGVAKTTIMAKLGVKCE
jgi:hypothetical protein